jgi:hypothetical protein
MAKTTVEECLALDVLEFARAGHLVDGAEGHLHFHRWKGDQSLGWFVFGDEVFGVFESSLYLSYYQTSPRTGETTHLSYAVDLDFTPTFRGKERPWFLCPRCKKRVGRLFLPPGETHFFCRTCHDLTYQSRRQRVPVWARAYLGLLELEEEIKDIPTDSRRWLRTLKRMERLEDALEGADLWDLFLPAAETPPLPHRGRGRPRKAERAEEVRDKAVSSTAPPERGRGRPREKRPYHRRSPLPVSERTGDGQAYCVKCRDFRDLIDPHLVTLSNGRPALQGACATCGCRLARVVRGETQPRGR